MITVPMIRWCAHWLGGGRWLFWGVLVLVVGALLAAWGWLLLDSDAPTNRASQHQTQCHRLGPRYHFWRDRDQNVVCVGLP